MTQLVLASSSPRRQALLTQLGIEYAVAIPDIDETVRCNECVESYVQRMARTKAKAGQKLLETPDNVVLGADTTVALDGQIIGKPVDQKHAAELLGLLSGKTHTVLSAVALHRDERMLTRLSASEVTFRVLSPAEIDWYCASGEPADKAGAYAIQGLGAIFVEKIVGSYTGIVGLPLFETAQLLEEFGLGWWNLGKSSRPTQLG